MSGTSRAMNAHQPSRSFAGCRTRAEAEARLREFLKQIADDSKRALESDLLCGQVDVDDINAVLDAGDELTADGIEHVVAQFHGFLDREGFSR
jgi:hypothetical protein